jgi:hypothetical protein
LAPIHVPAAREKTGNLMAIKFIHDGLPNNPDIDLSRTEMSPTPNMPVPPAAAGMLRTARQE